MDLKLAVILIVFSFAAAQYDKKPGDCPGPKLTNYCSIECRRDYHCEGNLKCCNSLCGGTSCEEPVVRRVPKAGKSGSCPPPSGPWVCSSRCGSDKDCRGSKKCCKNRCGAFACAAPVLEDSELFNEK